MNRSGQVGLGLIGAAGKFGQCMLTALDDVPRARLVALADVNSAGLARARELLGVERTYADASALIADPDVDAVIVATPPFTQAAIARLVIEGGKGLFLEKPGAVELADLRAVVDLQRSRRVAATIDYVMRFNPLLDVVRDIRRASWLGALRSAQFVNYAQDETLPPQHWFWNRERSGGIWVEHSVHFFDLYGDLTGAPPIHVVATGTVRDEAASAGRIDQVAGMVVHENGVLCSYFHAFNRPRPMEFQQALLAFDHGTITVHGWIAATVKVEAWVNDVVAEALEALPYVSVRQRQNFDRELLGRDSTWQADIHLVLECQLPYNRQENYRLSVAAGLNDLIDSMADRQHQQRVTLIDALRSLAVACVAAGTATMAECREIYQAYQPDGR